MLPVKAWTLDPEPEPPEWEAVEEFCSPIYFLYKAALEAQAPYGLADHPPLTVQELYMIKQYGATIKHP